MMGPEGSLWPTPGTPAVRSGHYMALLRTNLIWMPAMAIARRDAVARLGGFRDGFDAAADYDLYLRLAKRAPIHDHEQTVAAYRRHPGCMSGNAGRMLRDTLAVMRANHPGTDRDLAGAWSEGYRSWQDFYGTQLVEEMRRDVREHALWNVTRKAAVLLRFAPWVFRRELRRKLSSRTRDAGGGDLLTEPTRR
jgi:hypothetical protein